MTHTQQILNIISQFKNITRKEIIDLIDDPSHINFSARLVGMLNKGLVTRRKIQKGNREVWAYTATGKIPNKPGRRLNTSMQTKPQSSVSEPQSKTVNSALYTELEYLREWKRRALIACPELNVDPLIYKAREIFARHTEDKKLKDDIYSGKLDKRPPMLALIEVLENGA